MTVSTNTVAIPNPNVKLCTWKSEFPCYLTQPKITKQTPFGVTDTEYDLIKDEITRMECVEYNTSFGINMMNVDDIEKFANL